MLCSNLLQSLVTNMANVRYLSGTLLVLFLVVFSLDTCQGQIDDCSSIVARVTNGERAPKGRFPYMCSIRRRGSGVHACGGVLIGDDWMVTAAHCLDPKYPNSVGLSPFAYCNITAREDQDPSKRFSTQKCYLHPQWQNDIRIGSDIAVCKLDKSTGLPSPALANIGEAFNAASVFDVLGWGKTNFTSGPANYLQIGKCLSYRSNFVCNNVPIYAGQIKDSMICAGRGLVDTCEGDSGGPLLIPHTLSNPSRENPLLDVIVGITSFGHETCQGAPGVYTRVSCYREWIDCVMQGKGQDCNNHIPCREGTDLCSGIQKNSNLDQANALNRIGKAIQSDDSDTVKQILCEGLSPNAVFSDSSDSLLIRAARQSANKSAKVLLEHEANTEYKSTNGWTPLHIAAAYDSLAVAKELIGAKANLESRSDRRRTPLHLAAERDSLQVAKELVNNGANIETRISGGGTPVASAAWFGHVSVVQFLLDEGARVDAVNNDGLSALHWASARGKVTTVEILLDNRASKTKTTNAGKTPFDLICSANNLPRPCTDDEISSLRRLLLVT